MYCFLAIGSRSYACSYLYLSVALSVLLSVNNLQERHDSAAAAHSSWESGNQEARALRQAAVAMQQRSCELMQVC